jgi:hypothetical protein
VRVQSCSQLSNSSVESTYLQSILNDDHCLRLKGRFIFLQYERQIEADLERVFSVERRIILELLGDQNHSKVNPEVCNNYVQDGMVHTIITLNILRYNSLISFHCQ